MVEIILSSRKRADAKILQYKPERILSIGYGEGTHCTHNPELTLQLDFWDSTPNRRRSNSDVRAHAPLKPLPVAAHVVSIIRFAKNCEDCKRILVHCAAGKSRSTAAALIIWHTHGVSEKTAVAQLIKQHPKATPNGWLLALADSLFDGHSNLFGAAQKAGILKW